MVTDDAPCASSASLGKLITDTSFVSDQARLTDSDRFDNNRVDGYILMLAVWPGNHFCNSFDGVVSGNGFTENTITETRLRFTGEIQKIVVFEVNKEL